MITADKVTEIFCIADDFCKVFDAQMAKYSFKAERKEMAPGLFQRIFVSAMGCRGRIYEANVRRICA